MKTICFNHVIREDSVAGASKRYLISSGSRGSLLGQFRIRTSDATFLIFKKKKKDFSQI